MAYSKERLTEALRVFREAKAKDRCNLAKLERQASKYDFRRIIPSALARHLPVHQDSDSSGEEDDEYDPSSKKKKKKGEANKTHRPKRKAGEETDGGERKRVKGRMRDAVTRDSKEAYITLVLTSEKGKELLKDLGQRHNTDVATRKTSGIFSRLTDQSPVPMQRDLAARRKTQTYFDSLDLDSAQIDNRGCRALRSRKVPETEARQRKGVYDACINGRVKCTATANGMCVRCQAEEIDGIPYYEVRQADEDAHPQSPTCLPTPSSGSKDSGGSATESDRSVIILDDSPTSPHPPVRSMRSAIPVDGPRKSGFTIIDAIDLDTESRSSHAGRQSLMETCWAHPIDFKYLPNPRKGEPPCQFCSECLFGFQGLGRKVVEVLDFSDENGYQELGNGHRAEGKEPTKMCVRCALERLYMSNCQKHVFEPIPGVSQKTFKYQEYHDQIHAVCEGRAPAAAKLQYDICSICPCPAFFRCCFKQARNLLGHALAAGKEGSGCGLKVCLSCVQPLEEHGGLLRERYMRRHVQSAEEMGNARFFRADAEFLYPGSLLRRAYGEGDEKRRC